MNCAIQRGLTLLELLTGLAISMIAFGLGVPHLQHFIDSSHARTDKQQLVAALTHARLAAVNSNASVVVCSLNNKRCNGITPTITIFTDNNNDGYLDSSLDVIDKVFLNEKATITWTKSRIRYTPSGRSGGFNGTLKYCYKINESYYGFTLILARTGRLRSSNSIDHC